MAQFVTPASLDRRRSVGQALAQSALKPREIHHPVEALAQAIQGFTAGRQMRGADRDEATARREANALLSSAFEEGGGTRAIASKLTQNPFTEGLGQKMLVNDLTAQNKPATFGLNPVYGTDAQGKPVIMQMNNRGGISPVQLPDGVTPSTGFTEVDTGTGTALVDRKTNRVIQVLPKDIAGKAAEQERGKNTAKLEAMQPKAMAALEDLRNKRAIVLREIRDAKAILKESGRGAAGFGSLSAGIPETPAYELARRLDTIRANIGFEELNAMRSNSPTGGALGNVTERELAFLQSVMGSLDAGQSPQTLMKQFDKLERRLMQSEQARERAFQRTFGGKVVPQETGGFSEEDIRFTMQKHGLSREEVLKRLNR